MTRERERLIIVGDGRKETWEKSLAVLCDDYDLSLVSGDYPTWESAYVDKHRVADTSQYGSLFEAVSDLRGEVAFAGVIALDGASVPSLAAVAGKLRMRFVSPDTAVLCANREALVAAWREDGVSISHDRAEFVVPSVVTDRAVTPVGVVRLDRSDDRASGAGFMPDWQSLSWAAPAMAMVTRAHEVIGVDWAVTATWLRIVEGKVSVVDLQPWLGEDVVPTAVGPGLARAAAEMALDRTPGPVAVGQLAGGPHPSST